MHDVRLLARQALHAVTIDPDAMGERGARTGDADGVEIAELILPRLPLHHLQLCRRFRSVRVNRRAVALGQIAHRAEQRPGAGRRKPRREAIAQPAPNRAVPLLAQHGCLVERRTGVFPQPCGRAGGVHQAFTHGGAQTDGLKRLECRARVADRFHIENRRGAAEEQLGRAKHGGPVDRVGRVRCLEWPDALGEPIFQPQVVGEAAEQCLTQMNVGLNQTGDDHEAGAVDVLDARLPLSARPPDRLDAITRHHHVAVHNAAPRVHREDAGVLEEERGLGQTAYEMIFGRTVTESWARSK